MGRSTRRRRLSWRINRRSIRNSIVRRSWILKSCKKIFKTSGVRITHQPRIFLGWRIKSNFWSYFESFTLKFVQKRAEFAGKSWFDELYVPPVQLGTTDQPRIFLRDNPGISPEINPGFLSGVTQDFSQESTQGFSQG